jgi:hypothetical protein
MLRKLLFLSLILLTVFAGAQDTIATRSIYVKNTSEKIIIDGLSNEAAWITADKMTDFSQNKPIDGVLASNKTEVRILSDNGSIYVFAVCYDKKDLVINSLKRDKYGESDEFAIVIDPQGQKTNGYGFGVNAFGAQTEVLLSAADGDPGWDNKWFSAVKRYEDRWEVEMSIPFKSLRYNAGAKNWKVNFLRTEPGQNEKQAWSPVPRQFDADDMGYFGQMIWEIPPQTQGKNIALIPYATVSSNSVANEVGQNDFSIGGDAKIGITPSMNLDLTYNPDFSQVDVDQQVTNLTRFNIFFPERRQFFIENGDVFGGFGQGENQLFYSRRIGLDDRGSTVPILYGTRLTGNVTDKNRIGFFNIHSQNSKTKAGNNYTAFATQQRIFKRSQIRGIFLNRQSYTGSEKQADYGRNAGGDFNLSTSDGKWTSYGGYLHSFKQGVSDKNSQKYAGASYNGQNFQMFVEAQHTAKNYYTDMGFNSRVENYDEVNDKVFRIGYTSVGSMIDYNHYPKKSKSVNVHWSGLENFVWVNDDGTGLNEWYTRLRHFIFFKNSSALRFRLNNNFVNVLYQFSLRDAVIKTGKYNNTEFNIQYNSDSRKNVQGSIFAVYGSFYEGTKFTYRTNVLLRTQPWGNFTVGYEDNIIKLPNQSKSTHISLASLKAEINFSTKVFWTNFAQYNAQSNFFNINTRIQYRFSPMSDIFLVYTDNYDSDLTYFKGRNRSIILKASYWLGI